MDTMRERELNLKELPLDHISGEIYEFKGIPINMTNCGSNHFQMYRHIAHKLADKYLELQEILENQNEEDINNES